MIKDLFGCTVRLVCLSSLLLALGCGQADAPETDQPDSPDPAPAARIQHSPVPETRPDITVAQQELQAEPGGDPGLELVRRYTQMFYAGETEKLREKFSEEMQDEFPPGRLKVMRERVQLNLGEEIEVIGEDSQARDDYRGFVRWARFSKHEGVVEIQWVLRKDDTIAGFIIREAQEGSR
jgi:hypothetical protein